MIAHIVGLLLSWIILWLVLRRTPLVLGFTPLHKRILEFVIGFIFSGVLCTSSQLFDAFITNSSWHLNTNITWSQVGSYFVWNFNSVLFEELIFRGALLYIAIVKLGAKTAIIASAICFGIYHWFSYGLLGNVVPMIVVFFITGFMGLAWAYAFQKTGSMALPIGFHLGWNFVFNALFSKGFVSTPVFILERTAKSMPPEGILLLLNFLLQNIVPPLLSFLLVKFCFHRRMNVSLALPKSKTLVL